MTPKDKAQELFDKFIEFTQDWDELDGYVDDEYRAKQCALIAVHEILQITARDDYWRNIKQEIEKL